MFNSRSYWVTASAAGLFGVVAGGCHNDEGTVHSRTQDQTVRSDGTAVQTRSQVRETPEGTVRETQTQERKVISPSTQPVR